MKIYTEVNYKWLDGQLVETDSKSFDYEGELSLLGGSSGGGGGLASVATAVTDTAKATVKDPISTVTTGLGKAGDVAQDVAGGAGIQDAITTGMETAGENLSAGTNQGLANLEEGLSSGTSSLALNEGFATTLGDMGDNISTNMAPLVRAGDQVTQYSLDRINAGMDYIGQKGQELTNFIHNPNKNSTVTLDPDKFAVDSSKKKKNKSDLAVNKAKKRSRKSLRIG